MCPSISVQFSNFNSYFELLVAFTFAYASLKGFKDYINRVSLRAYDSFYSQKLQDVLAAVQVVAGPQTKPAIEEVNFNQYRDEIEKIEKICLGFYDDTFLQPMFFLAGLEYLFFLFIGGFQGQLGHLTVYLTVCLVFLFTVAYYLFVLIKLRQYSRHQTSPDNKKWLSSYIVLRTFGILNFAFLFVAAYLSYLIRSRGLSMFQDSDCFQGFFFCCGWKQLWESLGVMMAFAISVVPYLIYFFRNRLFIVHLEEAFDEKKRRTEQELERLVFKIVVQLSIIRPDEKT